MNISSIIKLSCLLNKKTTLIDRDIAIFHVILEIIGGREGFASNNEIIRRSKKLTEKTISSSIRSLKDAGLFSVTKRNGYNFYTCNFNL